LSVFLIFSKNKAILFKKSLMVLFLSGELYILNQNVLQDISFLFAIKSYFLEIFPKKAG